VWLRLHYPHAEAVHSGAFPPVPCQVIAAADNPFALDEIEDVLRAELACVARRAAKLPGGRALLLQAHARNASLVFSCPMLRVSRLHVDDGSLAGELRCTADALPFEDDAFRLVFVQHAGHATLDVERMAAECVRVLAPGGVLAWSGLNAWCPWYLRRRWGGNGPLPHAPSARQAARLLGRDGVVVEQTVRLGGSWPRRDPQPARSAFAPAPVTWLLSAVKKHVAVTPLRALPARARMPVRPTLVAPSQRSVA